MFKKTITTLALGAALATSAIASSAHAAYVFGFSEMTPVSQLIINGTTTLNATSTGWYDDTGFHDAINPNYFAGEDGGQLYNNYFVFSLSDFVGTIETAVLSVFNREDGFFGAGPEAYTVYDVSTPIETLVSTNSGLTSVYDDLGNGFSYGSTTVGDFSNGTFVNVALNPFAIAALQDSIGGSFAFGGVLGDGTTSVPPVPLPAALPMFVMALGALFGKRFIKRKATTAA